MTQRLTPNTLTKTALQFGQLLAALLLALGIAQSLVNAADAELGFPAGAGLGDQALQDIRGQGIEDEELRLDVDWGVILWDEDGSDRNGLPGSRDNAVHIRIEIGTQP